jgi:SAM-dependent methyltransferase
MSASREAYAESGYDFYGPHYRRFASNVSARIRSEVYGEDLGQTGWRTAAEQRRIAELLRLGPTSDLLDIACGSGGPSLALAEGTGCRVVGLDIEPAGVAHAQGQAEARGLADRAKFRVVDCAGRLPFADGSFAAVLCADAVSSLPDRAGTIREWARLLRRGGRLLFTDALVLTGEITKPEIDLRASQGVRLIVAAGCNEAAITAAGLALLRVDDTTGEIAAIAGALHDARARHADELLMDEEADWYQQRQRFLAATAELARTRRLSRFLYLAEKEQDPGVLAASPSAR